MLTQLVAMQKTLRSLVESCNDVAAVCHGNNASGLAAATYMVGESFAVFAGALNDYVLKEECDGESDA